MGRRSKNKKCGLCSIKRKDWEDQGFFGVNCKNKFIPMIVCGEHRTELTDEELEKVRNLAKDYYPNCKLKVIQNVNGHWYVYIKR